MADKKNTLHKYGKEENEASSKMEQSLPQLVVEESEYIAIEENKRSSSPRFKIVDEDGKSYGCSYAHLIDWMFSPPSVLTINTSTRSFILEGKNLHHIERLLMEEKIKELHVFNTQKHLPVADNKTVIEKLEVIEE